MLDDLHKVAMDPNAEVGVVGTVMSDNSPTIQISAEEMAMIKSAAPVQSGISMFPIENHSSELDEANAALESLYGEDEPEEDENIFGDDGNDDFDDKKDAKEAKTEKMLTIGAIVVTVLIAIILIVAIVSVLGSSKKKDTTTEEISTEAETLQMIDVVGLEEEKAIEALNEKGIEYEIERSYDENFDEGIVMSQDIAEGTELKEGDKVKLIISKGKEMLDVPDVVGKTLEEATALLTAAGFQVDEDDEYDDEVEQNYVISQSPSGETQAARGSTITIVVSKGKEVKVAVVPDLKKKTVQEAESALTEVNLKLGNVKQEYSDSIDEGKVIAQSIAAGTEIKEESSVDITISKGKKPTEATVVTYTASFSGAISNSSYSFAEGESVKVTLTLKVGNANYNLIDGDYYSEGQFPVSLSNIASIEDLSSQDATLTYSVKDANGNDITGNFASSGKATFKKVEQ
jgi:serine/threonine-protein kinase